MKRISVLLAVLAIGAAAGAGLQYEYAGMWGSVGYGNGEFQSVYCIAVAPDGTVYVTDSLIDRVQYFTPTGSYLGQWDVPGIGGIDISSSGVVYVTVPAGVQYFTPTGSFLNSWCGLWAPVDVAVAPGGNVYAVEFDRSCVSYYTSSGSLLGSWGSSGSGPGQFAYPAGIAVWSNGDVYVAEDGNDRVQYFTPTGSFLGMWGKSGENPGEFDEPNGVDVSVSGVVFVANTYNHCVDYFSVTGSWLGLFGGFGSGPGYFTLPYDVAVSPSGTRVYVTDFLNARVQYFDEASVAVVPTSLGRVKALFN